MKTNRLLIASLVPTIALVGWVSYELGVRSAQPPPAAKITSVAPVVPARVVETTTPEISAPAASRATPISAAPAPLSPRSDSADFPAPALPAAPSIASSPATQISTGTAAAPLATTASNRAPASTQKFAEFSDGETLVKQIDPSLPGNSFRSYGVRVAVAETTSSLSGDSRPSLGIDITPEASNETAASNAANDQGSTALAKADPAASNRPSNQAAANGTSANAQNPPALSGDDSQVRNRWGLTAEEEQFRTKWGWAALDDARTAAKLQAGK